MAKWSGLSGFGILLIFLLGLGCASSDSDSVGENSSSADEFEQAAAGEHSGDDPHESHDDHGEGHGHGAHSGANAHMHGMPFDSLVARFEDPSRNSWQRPAEVISALGPLSKLTVADLGAGTGYFSFPLAREASKVIALDIDKRFLDYIKSEKPRRLRVEARKTSENEINLKKGEADIILTVNTWHHIENRVDYAADLLSKLPEEGRFVIVDFFKEEQPVGPPPLLKVSHKRVRRELFQAGFETTSMDTSTLPYQYIITAYK